MKPLLCDLAFSHCLGIGPLTYHTLVTTFGSSEAAYRASPSQLRPYMRESQLSEFLSFRERFDARAVNAAYAASQITVLSRSDPLYPGQLSMIPDPPICLYVKGDARSLDDSHRICIAIVGTRRPTAYGLHVTRLLARELTEAAVTVVSGMALGIDAAAHDSCLLGKGSTVAVLGCGVNVIYPSENRELFHRIISRRGAVISEFPPDMTVRRGMFISRNRLISGLCRGTVVIEGGPVSGALSTARYAAVQGRDVFAVPGPITSEYSRAPNILIKQGATPVFSTQDILDAYHIATLPHGGDAVVSAGAPREQLVYDILHAGPLRADDIAHHASLSIADTLQSLSLLEMKGLIRHSPAGEYEMN